MPKRDNCTRALTGVLAILVFCGSILGPESRASTREPPLAIAAEGLVPDREHCARAKALIDQGRLHTAVAALVEILDADPEDGVALELLEELLRRRDLAPSPETRHARRVVRDLAHDPFDALVTSDEPGTPLILSGIVRDGQGAPIEGATVSVFHADVDGHYTPSRPMDEPNARLFGNARTGPDGHYEFLTVRPGGYKRRETTQPEARVIPQHVHVDVVAPGHGKLRQQVVFHDDQTLTGYWRQWAEKWEFPVLEVTRGGDGILRCVNDVVVER